MIAVTVELSHIAVKICLAPNKAMVNFVSPKSFYFVEGWKQGLLSLLWQGAVSERTPTYMHAATGGTTQVNIVLVISWYRVNLTPC